MMYLIGMQAEEGIGEYGRNEKDPELQPDDTEVALIERERLRRVVDSLSVEELSALWNNTKDKAGELDVVSESDIRELNKKLTPQKSRYDIIKDPATVEKIDRRTTVKFPDVPIKAQRRKKPQLKKGLNHDKSSG